MKKIDDFMKSRKGEVTVFCIIFILLLLLNCLTIWAADDYTHYGRIWPEGNILDLSRVFESVNIFYTTWSGRYLSTFVDYTILYFPRLLFKILNSIVSTFLIYIIYKTVKKDENSNSYLVLGIFSLIWLLVPAIGQIMFWQIGAITYLWMYTLVAGIILLFVNILKNKNSIKDNAFSIILTFILGLAAGNGFETNSIILLVFLTLVLLYNKFILKNKTPKWAIGCYIASIIGSCTNWFAPGNSVRMAQMSGTENLIIKIQYGVGPWFYNGIFRSKLFIIITLLILVYLVYVLSTKKKYDKKISLILFTVGLFLGSFVLVISMLLPSNYSMFLSWFYPNSLKFWFLLLVLLSMMLLMIVTFIINRKQLLDKTNSKTNYIVLILTIASLIGIAAYIMTPIAWPRSYMGMSITLIIAIVYVVERINYKKKNYITIVSIFLFSLSLIIYGFTLVDAYKATKWNNKTTKIIEEKIKNSESVIYVDTFKSTNSYNGASIEKWVIPIEENGEINKDYEWINRAITNYYYKDRNAWNEGKRIIGK